jgi:hypothetical protein
MSAPAKDKIEPVIQLPERIQRIVEDRKVTFGYTRKKNLGNYENEEASFYVSEYVPEGENIDQWLESWATIYDTTIKTVVWSALGLEWNVAEDGSVVLKPPPPPPTFADSPDYQRQSGARRSGTDPNHQPRQHQPPSRTAPKGSDNPTMAQVGYYADNPQFCKECGQREFYDNRTDNDTKINERRKVSPDWKCKNCGHGVWRPGSYDYNQAVGKPAAVTSPPGRYDEPFEDPFLVTR